jgi:hypothetical protein
MGYITRENLSQLEINKIEQAYWISECLLSHRTKRVRAQNLIADKYGYKTREEVNRAIEDAEHYIGTTFHVNRTYQKAMTLSDIEFCLLEAKTAKDFKSVTKLLELKINLLGLDEPEEEKNINYFDRKYFVMSFEPEILKNRTNLPDNYMELYEAMVAKARLIIKSQGEITEFEDVR